MNYDEARELDSGGWRWTTMNTGAVRTAWPCRECEPHETSEEAERHFYDACLEEVDEIKLSSHTSCLVCREATKSALGSKLLGRAFSSMTPLCDEHRTKEQLSAIRPFSPGMKHIHS